MILKLVNNLASPSGAKAKLSILIFHRVLTSPDPLIPDAPCKRSFERLLKWLTRSFNVLPLHQATQKLADGTLPARSVSITFDDGYLDNYTIALPLLRKYGLNATFFIATRFMDGGRMWNDTVAESIRETGKDELDLHSLGLGCWRIKTLAEKKSAIRSLLGEIKYRPQDERDTLVDEIAHISKASLPGDLMMSLEQVRSMRRAGMDIGAHTLTHPILARIDEVDAEAEIFGSKRELEQLLGEHVPLFAYPNGKPGKDYTEIHAKLVARAGFDAAVSTSIGAAQVAKADLYQLPRFTPWDTTETRFGLRLAKNTRHRGKTV